jgi:hypothetical protein
MRSRFRTLFLSKFYSFERTTSFKFTETMGILADMSDIYIEFLIVAKEFPLVSTRTITFGFMFLKVRASSHIPGYFQTELLRVVRPSATFEKAFTVENSSTTVFSSQYLIRGV